MSSVKWLHMKLPRVESSRRLPWLQVIMVVISVATFQFSAAVGQMQVVFQYGQTSHSPSNPSLNVLTGPEVSKLDNANITCLGDFSQTRNNSLVMTLPVNIGSEQGIDVSGRCLYKSPVQLIMQKSGNSETVTSFSTMFQISINSAAYSKGLNSRTLQRLAFIITNDTSTQGEAGGYLDWLNSSINGQKSGHNFAVQLLFFQDAEFNDRDGVRLGLDINGLISWETKSAGSLANVLTRNEGPISVNVWIEYDGLSQVLDIYLSEVFSHDFNKPTTALRSATGVGLSQILSQDDMFVGFSGSITNVTFAQADHASHDSSVLWMGYTISDWTFNSNGPAPDFRRDRKARVALESVVEEIKTHPEIVTLVSLTVPFVFLFLVLACIIWVLYKRNSRLNALAKKYKIKEGNRGPQKFKYQVLSAATKEFSPQELLGRGGLGSVYKGALWLNGPTEKPTIVAVKRICADSDQEARGFLVKMKVVAQLQHRNLVRLFGWCHDKAELLLVYDYMPNGSVDQHLFNSRADAQGESVLSWSRRLKIASGIAAALAYLHEEGEPQVIHGDVKSSKVMLDKEFNARLGDFGLARLSSTHDRASPSTVALAGTYGYLAPEMAQTLKATAKTDVYSFGIVVLELATGKRPIMSVEDRTKSNQLLLVDWVWDLYKEDHLLEAADWRLQKLFEPAEMLIFVKIGLLCSHPDSRERPNMREVLNIWKGLSPFPLLPRTKPSWSVVTQLAADSELDSEGDTKTSQIYVTSAPNHCDYSDESEENPIPIHECDMAVMIFSSDDSHGSNISSGGSPMPSLPNRPSNPTSSLPF